MTTVADHHAEPVCSLMLPELCFPTLSRTLNTKSFKF